MDEDAGAKEDTEVVAAIDQQLAHFRRLDPPCRGIGLPDGLILRHSLSRSLYFYLRTRVEEGKIKTQVFASDSPYDRQKASIGSVVTPMFEADSDQNHLHSLEQLVRSWADFVRDDINVDHDFHGFQVNP